MHESVRRWLKPGKVLLSFDSDESSAELSRLCFAEHELAAAPPSSSSPPQLHHICITYIWFCKHKPLFCRFSAAKPTCLPCIHSWKLSLRVCWKFLFHAKGSLVEWRKYTLCKQIINYELLKLTVKVTLPWTVAPTEWTKAMNKT